MTQEQLRAIRERVEAAKYAVLDDHADGVRRSLRTDSVDLLAEVEKLRGLLRDIEKAGLRQHEGCPLCGNNDHDFVFSCALAAALKDG